MARKFFIAKVIPQNTPNGNVYFLLEEINGILVDHVDKNGNLYMGTDKMNHICTELMKIRTEEREKSNVAERAFTVSNLLSETMTVETDSSLVMLLPLTREEMINFYNAYAKKGNYTTNEKTAA